MIEIIRGMSFEDYAKRPGINATLLKMAHYSSLEHCKAYLDGKSKPATDEMTFGKAFHARLEGLTEYVIQPAKYISEDGEKPWNWNAKVCKQWREAQGGKEIMTAAEVAAMDAMVAKIRSKRELAPLLDGDREISIFAEKDGLPIKARLDLLPSDPKGPVIDWKSCASAQPEKFVKSAYNLGYHIQCAWILDVLRAAKIPRDSVWLVGIEQAAPNAMYVPKFSDRMFTLLRVGRKQARVAFQKLKTAFETGEWPDYGSSDAEDNAPPWALKEIENLAA